MNIREKKQFFYDWLAPPLEEEPPKRQRVLKKISEMFKNFFNSFFLQWLIVGTLYGGLSGILMYCFLRFGLGWPP